MRQNRNRAYRQPVPFIDQNRVFFKLGAVFLPPLTQGKHCRQQIETFFCQTIFDLAAIIGARFALENSVFDQFGKSIRKNVAGDPKLAQEFFEMMKAIKARAQDHEGPTFPHYFKRLRQTAFQQLA